MTKKQKRILIGCTVGVLASLVFFSKSQSCHVSDFRLKNSTETNSSGFSKEAACEKAMATCKAYSSFSENCRIKN